MSTDRHKAIVHRFFKAFVANDQASLIDLLAPELVVYLPGEAESISREEFLDIIQRWSAAFSGLDFGIKHQIAEQDMVATHLILKGVHNRGDFLEIPPTGKSFSVSVMTIERITDNQIKERRVVFDLLDFIQQLGVTVT